MKFRCRAFNIYLVLITCGFLFGCKTTEEKTRSKELSTLRLHLELPPSAEKSAAVSVHGVPIAIEKEAFLTEVDVAQAVLVDTIGGGYSVQVDFNQHGTLILDMVTGANKGKRIAVFSQCDKARWVGAPMIMRRNANGMLVFTPDCSREQADRLVRGLNNLVRKIHKKSLL